MLGGFGFNQKPLDTVEMYSPRLDQWSSLPVSLLSGISLLSYFLFNLKIKLNSH